MKLLEALFYQFYWNDKDRDDDTFITLDAYITIFAITTLTSTVWFLVAMSLKALGITVITSKIFLIIMILLLIITFITLWSILIRNDRFKKIIENHELYDQPKYKHIVIKYAIIMVSFAILALYIGYTDNIARDKIRLNMQAKSNLKTAYVLTDLICR